MPRIGPTPNQRKEITRLMEKGAALPDVDWDTMPSTWINTTLRRVKLRWSDQFQDRRRAVRHRLWATGESRNSQLPWRDEGSTNAP